jgi:hypothetical protein
MLAAFDEVAVRADWPGFDASQIPLAITDGERTYLVRHPAPPPDFRELRGLDGAYGLDSVYSAMRANTSVEIGGALTATIRTDPEGLETPETLVGLLLHEAFHVFQSEHHPEWTANEVDLFVYPVARVVPLQQRRLETGALRRALAAPDSVRTLCWSDAFLRTRTDRFERLPPEAVAYERGTELREGLARYMESTAVGGRLPDFPAEGFAPEDVRERAYDTGHALARLLDLVDPEWKRGLEAGEVESLDSALMGAMQEIEVRRCGHAPDETRRALTVAGADSANLMRLNAEERNGFEAALGWRVVIEAPAGRPLSPGGFDPLNVRTLDGTYVLHSRWLQLSNESATIEVLDRASLTLGVGPHPLFNGVRRLTVTGIRSEPEVVERGDSLKLVAEGVDVSAQGATLEREGRVLRLELGG